MKPTYLNVAVPVPLRRSFHYLPPKDVGIDACQIGARVEIPFGRQKLCGIIIGFEAQSEFAAKVRPALRLLDVEPIFDASLFELCKWSADYYHHAIGEVFSSAIPVLLRQGRDATGSEEKLALSCPDLEALKLDLVRAPRQRALVELLAKAPQSRDALKAADFAPGIIKALTERGAAGWQRHDPAPPRPLDTDSLNFGAKLTLSGEQQTALTGMSVAGTHLLFGVTGSGKTEVYLQAIERVVRAGQQALVLVPEIGLTPQTIARFEQRFPGMVAAQHSGMTNADRLNAWQRARSGAAAVIIGTRSAIFTPLLAPGLIVVDEEHDASFKQQDGFRYSARDLAVKRGHMHGIPVVLGSATPSLETFANAKAKRYSRFDLTERANQAQLARFQVIGIEHQTLQEGFSPTLIELIKQHLSANNQVLVFLNRRGFAPVLHCRQCGWLSNCPRCDSRMTYHLTTKRLVCHHCEHQQRSPAHCPECSAKEIVPLGYGTQRLEHGLRTIFPDEQIIRIDRDSTRKKHELENKLAEVAEGHRGILLGTQLLAKGHHFPDVTLVAVIDIDSGLYSSDYHALERMGQLLIQVGGRAGRGSKPGTVAIQTHYPEQPMLKTLLEAGYEAFSNDLLLDRSANDLPPSGYQAIFRAEALNAGSALGFLEQLSQLAPNLPQVELLGPIPAPMEKRAGRFRAQLLVASQNRGALHRSLNALIQAAEQSPETTKVRWSVDVDPYDLF